MAVLKRMILAAPVVVMIGLLGPVSPTTASSDPGAKGPSFSGHWRYTAAIHCAPSAQTSLVCSVKLGRQSNAVNWAEITGKANGSFTFTGGYVTSEDTAKAPERCDPRILSQPYNGSCLITNTGTGDIKPGILRTNDFFITSEQVTYHRFPKNLVVRNPMGAGAYPEDTGVPAKPGVYDAKRLLAMAGLGTPPPGLYIKIQVDHHS